MNQATFAEGLAREGGLKMEAAWSTARVAAAAVSPRGLFLRADLLARMPLLERVGLIAHELAHMSQLEMRRGGRGQAAQWIREGHAEWVQFKVVEWLGMQPFDASRDEVRRSILRSRTAVKFFPNLTELARGDQWKEAVDRLGKAATYGQAFLAVDRLIERYGLETLHTVLRQFALDDDPRGAWARSYPIPYGQFAREFRTHLEQVGNQLASFTPSPSPTPTSRASADVVAATPTPHAADRLVGTWTGTLRAPGPYAAPTNHPATLRIHDDRDGLRWSLEASGGDLDGRGAVVRTEQGIALVGTLGRRAVAVSLSVTLAGSTLQATGLGANNALHTLTLERRR